MKKTYISPETRCAQVCTCHHLMAGSAKGSSVFTKEASESETVLGRKSNNIWEEDEEYDELLGF